MHTAACFSALGVLMFLSRLSHGDIFDIYQNKNEDVPCAVNAYPPLDSWKIPKFAINLDLPPSERWDQLTKAYTKELRDLVNLVRSLTQPIFHGLFFKLVDKYMPALVDTLPYPFADEIKGIANSSDIPLGHIALYNIFYELVTFCTSILAQSDSGQLFHARNLDFGALMGWDYANNTWLATELLRKMTVQLNFQRNGTTVFESTSFAGYIGIATGMKPNMFSLTIDSRFQILGGYVGILKWLLGYRKSSWIGFLNRQLMENTTSYGEAQMMLSKMELVSPVYFILGGNKPGEACVITRGLTTTETWEIGSANNNNTWFLVETNYDHWKSPLWFDNRRKPAVRCLNELGQKKLSFDGLFNVLSTRPVLNKQTTYTTLMEVASGKFESYKQFCPDPCPIL